MLLSHATAATKPATVTEIPSLGVLSAVQTCLRLNAKKPAVKATTELSKGTNIMDSKSMKWFLR